MLRPWLDLEMIGIPLGALLVHVDRPHETCIVVGWNPARVAFRGEVLSLTAAATKAYNGKFEATTPAALWKYNDETLQDRRHRFEEYHRPRE